MSGVTGLGVVEVVLVVSGLTVCLGSVVDLNAPSVVVRLLCFFFLHFVLFFEAEYGDATTVTSVVDTGSVRPIYSLTS